MSGFTFDANIVIDALAGYPLARAEIKRAVELGARPWISRMAWIEVLSKGDELLVREALEFLSRFGVDEIDEPLPCGFMRGRIETRATGRDAAFG